MAMTAIAGVGALGSLLGGMGGLFGRNNNQQNIQNQIAQEQLDFDRQNALQQQLVQAMVNQRAVAGSTDSFGTTVKYDPATNQWVTAEGALPQQADTAAMQAGITRNTTDLQQQELANTLAMRRAAQAGPAADTALRNLQDYRPMTASDLTSALTSQAIDAARATYDPLRADTLRSVARTGTAAGPVLAQLGKSEALNLRDSLRDAMISGMENVGQINASRLGGLQTQASTTAGLASPQLGQSNIQPSTAGSTMAQLVAQRAGQGAYTTAAGMPGANAAAEIANKGATTAMGAVPNQNYGMDAIVSGMKDIGTSFSKGGTAYNFLQGLLSNPNSSPSGSGSYTPAYGSASQNYAFNDPSYQNWTPDSSQYNW